MLARGVIVHGPVDSLDQTHGRISVLGQSFKFGGTKAQMSSLANRIATGEVIVATVTGAPDQAGTPRAQTLSLSTGLYVPGSTPVMIVGKVRSVDTGVGAITVGRSRIDYSAVLTAGTANLSPGQIVAVIGVRSAPDLPLVAASLKTF